MARWFRSHAAKLESRKIQSLSNAEYRAWDSLLCVACAYDGILPSVSDTAFMLRKSEKATQALIDAMILKRLFVETERGVEPHQWNEHQYKSDVSTDRVKQHRERKKQQPGNVSVTPSETEADTEQKAEAKASGAEAPTDLSSLIFGQGLMWLQEASRKSRDNCASQLGKWRKQLGDEALITLLGRAQREGVIAPMEWMEGAIRHHKTTTDPPQTGWN